MKPNVLCVGFAKCGTTTFYDIMKQHKDIFLSGIKEPIYYNKKRLYSKGFEWYQKRYYPKKVRQKIIMEINPMIGKRVEPQTIMQDYGKEIKIIFLIRNPMERLYSNFKMNLSVGGGFPKYEDNIDPSTSKLFNKWLKLYYNQKEKKFEDCKKTNYIANGEYYQTIKKYIDIFGKDNIKIIVFEDFIKNQHKICQEVYEFIGIEEDEKVKYNLHSNENNRLPISDLSIKMNRFFHHKIYQNILIGKLPYVSKTFCSIIDYISWTICRKIFTKKDKRCEKILPEDKELLKEYYYSDVQKLSKLIDVDLIKKWKM